MISNKNKIEMFMHCRLCLEEYQSNPEIHKKIPPKDYARTQAGWTKEGLQVWCNRHDCNVLHIDFEGQKHPANTSREKTKSE